MSRLASCLAAAERGIGEVSLASDPVAGDEHSGDIGVADGRSRCQAAVRGEREPADHGHPV